METVNIEGEVVPGGFVARNSVGITGVPRGQHVVLDRVRMFGERLSAQVVSEADGHAVGHATTGPLRMLVGEEVQRTALIVATPAAPVLEGVIHLIEFCRRGDLVFPCHASSLSAGPVGCLHCTQQHFDQVVDEAVIGEDAAPTAIGRVGGPGRRRPDR